MELITINNLLPHEEIIPKRVEEIKQQILGNKLLDYPIIADKKTYTILDGHHRYTAFLELKIPQIPVLLIDYLNDDVMVSGKNMYQNIDKETVIKYAQLGKLFPPKSTKHSYNFTIKPINFKIGK